MTDESIRYTYGVQPLTKEVNRLAVIESCQLELATNFDVPASQILGYYGARLGVSGETMAKIIREVKP